MLDGPHRTLMTYVIMASTPALKFQHAALITFSIGALVPELFSRAILTTRVNCYLRHQVCNVGNSILLSHHLTIFIFIISNAKFNIKLIS
jgi:hypothetical protein